ncbi:MAG: Crp/Fnr family transcriptional regulator [Filimonas sp.]|nr:Crp/Fnr family transcriptional regulator [Filimonas sp.]
MQLSTCDTKRCFLCTASIPEWRDVITARKETRIYKKGELIFTEGDKVSGIYFVYEGAVKVHTHWGEEKELIIRFSTTGDILGHRGIAGEVYPVSATALEDTKVCFITNEFLEATMKTNPLFTQRLLQFYASELQKAERRMRNLAHMEVKGRIAETLLELQQIFGINKEKYIKLPITRQDISAHAGTTYETVFKFFTELTNANIITTSGKSIRINSEKKLRAYIPV